MLKGLTCETDYGTILIKLEIVVCASGSFKPRHKTRRIERDEKQCIICSSLMDNIFHRVSI